MNRLSRLCYIITDDVGEMKGCARKQDTTQSVPKCAKTLSRTKRFGFLHQYIAAFLRRLKWKWIEYCRHPADVLQSQTFEDADGVLLGFIGKPIGATPRVFSYSELYVGSNGFSEKGLLGRGGFGRVYKAVLPSDGTEVAVKCVADKVEAVGNTFMAELTAVARLRHRNLVRLRGWCVHEDQVLLVYDYMPNGSLDKILFNGKTASLGWKQRKSIVTGLAAALFYIHDQMDVQIVHRDVKTSNVMLDQQFGARLGDFGMARWIVRDFKSLSPSLTRSTVSYKFRLTDSTHIGGTIGYLPPESFDQSTPITAKSDVFSFGVVVMEVVSGRRAVDLAYPDDQIVLLDWVRELSDQSKLLEAADASLPDGSFSLVEMQHLLHIGLLCSLPHPHSRPSMSWVMQALSPCFSGELPSLPSFLTHPRYISVSFSPPSITFTISSTTVTTVDAQSDAEFSHYQTPLGSLVFFTACDEFRSSGKEEQDALLASIDTAREIRYSEILTATRNFSKSHIVAEGDFGISYRGYLENRLPVLVKRLALTKCPALRGRFSDELRNLANLRHRNLVQLRGWCTEHGEMLVVYDFLPQRSLSRLLFCHKNALKWYQRYSIIKSLACAILYLHEEWEEQVIHRCITSSSVFIEADMNPRLGSFSLAEFLTRNTSGHNVASSSSTRGIFGYMSPEYMEFGEATTSADIYSFGVVVLEVVTGWKAVDLRWPKALLVERIRDLRMKGRSDVDLVDERLDGDYNAREFRVLLQLGLACTTLDPKLRPAICQIVSSLARRDFVLPELPNFLKVVDVEFEKCSNSPYTCSITSMKALGIQ